MIQNFNPRTREGCDEASPAMETNPRQNFNPRTREGCDQNKRAIRTERIIISIHAPVKGATAGVRSPTMNTDYFNPRTREGCDNV